LRYSISQLRFLPGVAQPVPLQLTFASVKWARGQINPLTVTWEGSDVAVLVIVAVGIMFLGGLIVGVAVWVAVAVAVGRSVAVGSGVLVLLITTGSGSVGCTAAGAEQALEIVIIKSNTNINFFIGAPFLDRRANSTLLYLRRHQ